MTYNCEMPGCLYVTTNKHQIHHHHIIPKSSNGTNKKYNILRACPSCHHKIYIPGTKRGIHSIKANNYIILYKISLSSNGYILEFERNNKRGYVLLDTWRKFFNEVDVGRLL